MRKSQLGLIGVLATTALLALPTVAAASKTYRFSGGYFDGPSCNSDVRVHFDATLRKGAWDTVDNFVIKGMNLPNTTPPIPFGIGSGDCVPYYPTVVLFYYDPPEPAYMYFHHASDPLSRFKGQDALEVGPNDIAIEAWKVEGDVHTYRRHHRFRTKAVGYFGFATSEAGLDTCNGNPCGGSSGEVDWKAKGHLLTG